jgi:molecular chaperone DnaJ
LPASEEYIKDYYRILQVKKTSGDDEIKKSYRNLAFKYHPDKNPGDEISASVFTEINEAYQILSDKEKRTAYNESLYYYAPQEIAKPFESLESLTAKAVSLNKIIASSNPFHINNDALLWSIQALMPDEIFSASPNNLQKEKLFFEIMDACKTLSYHHLTQISFLIFKLAGADIVMKEKIDMLLLAQKRKDRWEKNKIWLASALAIALCFIIYFISKKK